MSEAIVFTSIVFGGLLFWFASTRETSTKYRKKNVLTGSEREFFYRLRHALPECVVCPQMAVSALIEPMGIGVARKSGLDRIRGERVGYAIFDEKMHLIAIVEIDHRSRTSRRDMVRDAYFAKAGIRTVRFSAKRLPSEGKIKSSIYARDSVRRQQAECINTADRKADIEFVRPEVVWRNTANAQI
ncbi:hypothetical protein GCM10027343_23400 [Noviherbaspirillum agri]